MRVGVQEKYEESRNKNIEGDTTHKKGTHTKSVKETENKLIREVGINEKKNKGLKTKTKNNFSKGLLI